MNNKRTITTREQIKINGEIRERTATHIVTGAHGYETLCISGYIVEHNEMGEVIHNSEKLAEDLGNDSNLLIVFYVQIMPDDFVMQLHR
ncbi:hypothetical protein ABN347_25755, partial [Klebsiella pneumoniae]